MPSRRFVATALVAAALPLVSAAQSSAADAVAPVDGATVPSLPLFSFDFEEGVADVSLSRSPEVRTEGDRAGAFVDPGDSSFFLMPDNAGDDPGESPGVYRWESSRLVAGRYFWRAQVSVDHGDETWTPVRSFIVADEPVVFEGWLVRVKRLSARGRCRTRLRVRGTIAFADNVTAPTARYSVTLTSGTRKVGSLTGAFDEYENDFSGVVCLRRPLRASRLTAAASLRDPGGHVANGPAREVVVGA